ncbi:MAG: class I SAM-dependent methyltransferase [Anaerolineaceae bacterium]
MENLLKQTFLNHTQKVSDKWTLYINEWDRIFYPYRDDPINLFEIGIQNGGSLEIWAKYFTNANKIIGCDIDEKCRELSFADPRIELLVGDANTDEIQEKVLEKAPKYDLIIDDGSHKSSDVIRSFSRYFPYLEDNGVYVVEDLHASYWQDFEGGLFDPTSSISFFKRLADIVNAEHWRNNQSREGYLSKFIDNLQISFSENDLYRIHSIEFLNSVCIIKKRRPDENVLGKRIVVGTEELVTEGLEKLDGTSSHDFTVAIKDDSDLDIFELIKRLESANQSIGKLTLNLGEKEQTIADLGKDLTVREHSLEKLTADLAEREQTVEKLTADLAEREQAMGKLTADLAEREETVQKLSAELVEMNQTFQSQTIELASRANTVEKLTGELAEKDQVIQSMTTDLAERDEALQSLQDALTESQNEVVLYAQSSSWKLTRPLRRISKFLKGNKRDQETKIS